MSTINNQKKRLPLRRTRSKYLAMSDVNHTANVTVVIHATCVKDTITKLNLVRMMLSLSKNWIAESPIWPFVASRWYRSCYIQCWHIGTSKYVFLFLGRFHILRKRRKTQSQSDYIHRKYNIDDVRWCHVVHRLILVTIPTNQPLPGNFFLIQKEFSRRMSASCCRVQG